MRLNRLIDYLKKWQERAVWGCAVMGILLDVIHSTEFVITTLEPFI